MNFVTLSPKLSNIPIEAILKPKFLKKKSEKNSENTKIIRKVFLLKYYIK